MESESEIANWYRGKTIFITGATGFMGKVLVEKLLRSCPEAGPIYVLIREKKNVQPQDRVAKLMSCGVFDELRATREDQNNWIFPIIGDVGLPDLGISAEDRRLLQETVSVVFHLAATVRFDEPLQVAVAMNLDGTRALLELCRGMTSLCAVVHVSTAYSNCILPVIEERVYPPPADPNKVQNCVAGLNDDLLSLVTPSLIGTHPNTYTFTKALAEHVVAGYSTELPIVVVRPSVVSASWREPQPGWVDSFKGSNALIVPTSTGLLKTVYGRGDLVIDVIPVDVCINLFIAAAWEIGTRESSRFSPDVLVYNCVSGPFKPITWREAITAIVNSSRKSISNKFMPLGCGITDSRVQHTVTKTLLQTLPAAMVDFFTWLSGGEPRLQYYQRQINKAMTVFEFVTMHEWEFAARNVERLNRQLSPVDQKVFDFDMKKINWTEYFDIGNQGIRRYLLNGENEKIHTAKKSPVVSWNLLSKVVQFAVLIFAPFIIMRFYGVSISGA